MARLADGWLASGYNTTPELFAQAGWTLEGNPMPCVAPTGQLLMLALFLDRDDAYVYGYAHRGDADYAQRKASPTCSCRARRLSA